MLNESSLNEAEMQLVAIYRKLNELGKEVLAEQADLCINLVKYTSPQSFCKTKPAEYHAINRVPNPNPDDGDYFRLLQVPQELWDNPKRKYVFKTIRE